MTANVFHARTAAYDLLEELEISQFPVSPLGICDYFGIKYDTFSGAPKKMFQHSFDIIRTQKIEAMSYVHNGDIIILFDDSGLLTRRRFTIAHEIGHIILKHHLFPPDDAVHYFPSQDYKEVEANNFAGELLRPAALIRKFNLTDTETIMHTFFVSRECAAVGLSIANKMNLDMCLDQYPFFNYCSFFRNDTSYVS